MRTGPRHPRLAAAVHDTMYPVFEWFYTHQGFHHRTSPFATSRINAVREKLDRGETAYVAGVGLAGIHNSGVALVELTRAGGARLICNNEEERKRECEVGMLEDVIAAFPEESRLVGQLLLSYGTLELDLLNCVAIGCQDYNLALKTLFITRGETPRIKMAREVGRKAYDDLGLTAEFAACIKGMFNCVGIRNKYAHGVWHDDQSGKLTYVDLEEVGKDDTPVPDLRGLTKFDVEVELLKKQLAYFDYVSVLLRWTGWQTRVKRKTTTVSMAKPLQIDVPPSAIKRTDV